MIEQVSQGSQYSHGFYTNRNQSASGLFFILRHLPPPGPGTGVARV